jgi:uncharacterized MnhB-related membrane protein
MLRKIMIVIMSLIMLSLLASLLVEIVAERYLNAVALFGVASVLMWFALQMLQRRTHDVEAADPDDED